MKKFPSWPFATSLGKETDWDTGWSIFPSCWILFCRHVKGMAHKNKIHSLSIFHCTFIHSLSRYSYSRIYCKWMRERQRFCNFSCTLIYLISVIESLCSSSPKNLFLLLLFLLYSPKPVFQHKIHQSFFLQENKHCHSQQTNTTNSNVKNAVIPSMFTT